MIWILGAFIFLISYVILRLVISNVEFPDIDDIGTWEDHESVQQLPKKIRA